MSANMDVETTKDETVLVQIKSENGEVVGNFLDLPRTITSHQLQLICNALLQKVSSWNTLPVVFLLWSFIITFFF